MAIFVFRSQGAGRGQLKVELLFIKPLYCSPTMLLGDFCDWWPAAK
jgi:hypothetical protein